MDEYKITIEVDSASMPAGIENRNELYDYMFAECQNNFGDFFLKVERA